MKYACKQFKLDHLIVFLLLCQYGKVCDLGNNFKKILHLRGGQENKVGYTKHFINVNLKCYLQTWVNTVS